MLVLALVTSWLIYSGSHARTLKREDCPVGLWGLNCTRMCSSGCRQGCYWISGLCVGGCGRGWKGSNCEQMCDKFYYGYHCKQSCGQCLDDKPCNIVTGVCEDGCNPGFGGEKCKRACEPYTFGISCNRTCGHCSQGRKCNSANGICDGGCADGWLGETCHHTCPRGLYGANCSNRCAHCTSNSTCDHVTGNCTKGCAPGWTGARCDERCTAGKHGPDCQDLCGRCQIGTCDHVTGECYGGCTRGYHGTNCQDECPPGLFGANCTLVCGACRTMDDCDRVNGFCKKGCARGWEGTHCKQNCTPGTYGSNCKHRCGHCAEGKYCDVISGDCPQECAEGWDGRKCDTGVLRTGTAFYLTPVFPIVVVCLAAAAISLCSFFTYFACVRPRKTALRRLYADAQNNDSIHNAYEQISGSPWELQRGQLSLGNEFLGNGQFGNVKKGHVKINGVKLPVAIKSLKDNASEKDKEDFINELSILKRVGKHDNVVCLVGACHIRGAMYVAMEFAKHGDLRTFLRRSRRLTSLHEYHNTSAPTLQAALRPQTLLGLALGAARGLRHLSEQQIIHRDVAARNVLLGDKLVAKIADFGLSKNDQTYVKTSSTRVPIRWMALESLFNNTYTLQSDVWSFGVLLWEIFTLGGTPYSAIDTQQLLTYLNDGHRLRKPRLCDQGMYAMMLQCWNDAPERRPVITELVARLERMLERSQVYINLSKQEESFYAEIDHNSET